MVFANPQNKRTWPPETIRIRYWAFYSVRGDGGIRGQYARGGTEGRVAATRFFRFVEIIIFLLTKVRKEFIYGIVVGGAALLVRNILGVSRELEALETGGEEGRMGPRVEVVVSHA